MTNPNKATRANGGGGRIVPDGITIGEPRKAGGLTEGQTIRDVTVQAGPLTWRTIVIEDLVQLAIVHGMAVQAAQRKFDADLDAQQKGSSFNDDDEEA